MMMFRGNEHFPSRPHTFKFPLKGLGEIICMSLFVNIKEMNARDALTQTDLG